MGRAHPAKKVAAAVAAVLHYLTEVEAIPASPAPSPAPPLPALASWGLAGRQESMVLRDLWQRRIPKAW